MQDSQKTGEQPQADPELPHAGAERYRYLVADSMVGVWELDDAGRTVFANSTMAAMLGYTEQEMLGRPFWDFPFDEQDAALARKKLFEGVRGRNDRFEFRFRHKNGDPVWTEIMGRILVKSRRLAGGVAQVVDISARKRTELIHQARFRLIQFAADHSLNDLLVATLDEAEILTGSQIGFYHFLSADQKTLELQAWSTRTRRETCKASGVGLHYDVAMAGVWVDCIHEHRTVFHNDYASLPHRKGMPAGHAPVIRELVTPVIRNNAIVAILGVGNKPTDYGEADVEAIQLLADLAWDIAEQKRSIQALRESEEKFRVVADFTNDWEIWSHPDGHYLYISPSCETITGYTPQEFAQRLDLVTDIAHPDDRELYVSHVKRYLPSGDSGHIEYRIVTKSGEVRWISHQCRNVQDSQGRQLGRRISNRDVTRRKQAEEEIRRLNRELERRVAERTASLEAANAELRQRTAELQHELAERRRAEEVLRISKERYRMAQEIGHVGNWEYNIQTTHFWGSDEARRIFGFDAARHAFTTEEVENCIPERQRVHQALVDLIEAGKPYNLEYEMRPRNSTETRIIASIAELQRDDQGRPLKVVGVIQDITERKRAEEALRSERERSMLGRIAEASPVAIMMVESDGLVTFANRQADILLGLTKDEITQPSCDAPQWPMTGFEGVNTVLRTPDERTIESDPPRLTFSNPADAGLFATDGHGAAHVIGETFWSLVHPDDLARVQEDFKKWIRGEETTSRYEARIMRRDGRIRWVDVSATVTSFNGVIANLVILHDLTQRKREEQFRADVERIIRHDIKSPLSGIYGLAELATKHQDRIDLTEFFPQITRGIRQVIRLLDASEQMRKMEAGEYVMQRQPVDMSRIIRDVTESLFPLAEQGQVRIAISGNDGTPSPGIIHGEDYLIEDMLMNLVKNAIEASPYGERVSVGLRTDDDCVRIDIHNTGAIPISIREKFFDKYSSAGKPGGMGLGTYSALLIAKAHGGKIDFNTSDTEGTTITVVIPRPAESTE